MTSAFPDSQIMMTDTDDIPDLLLLRQHHAQLLIADDCEDDSSIKAAILTQHGISERELWNTGHTVVHKYTWEGSSSADGRAAEPASVAEKIWDAERVRRDGGYVQVAAEMKCAFWGVDERSLVVVPIEYNIGVSSGLSVYYPYAGTNLAQHFNLLRATHSPNLYEQINIAAVHLGLGLEDVHKRNLVLRDCKATNALLSANDGIYRWSDAGLSCTTGSRSGGGDDSRPAPDHVRRYGSGRVHDCPRALSMMNDGPLDVYAYGVVLYEAAVGELPRPININCRYDYIRDVPGYSEQELWDMDTKAREKILLEAMFDRTVEMVENRGWLPYLRDNIAPHDMMLASFLTRILRPREDRAPLEELMQHEYIASILTREQARIESALPAWRARVQAAGEVAKVVKLARAAEEVQHLLQQRFAARSGGTTTGSSSSNSNSSMGLASSDCSPSGSSSIGSQVEPVQYNKPCVKSGSCNSTAEHSRRYSGDTSGSAADTADQLASLDDNSSSTSGMNTRQPSKGWGSCSSSSSNTDTHAGDSTTELPEAMPALASLNQHQPQAFGTQAASPQAATTAPPQSPSAMPGAACAEQQHQQPAGAEQQQQAEPQPAGLSACSAGVTQHQQQPQAAELEQQLHAVQQQRQELEREACLAAAWLAVQQQELQEMQAALRELQQQVEAVEAANAAAGQQVAAYQQRLVVAVQPPSLRPAAAGRVLPASTPQGGRLAGGHWQHTAPSICASCSGAADTAINLRSHPIDIDMDDEDDDFVY